MAESKEKPNFKNKSGSKFEYLNFFNMIFRTINEKETIKVARDFAKKLRGGETILLYGDLGVGKTIFAKGLAKALGIKEIIKSPTLNILKCYSIPKYSTLNIPRSFCHIDAYRLKNLEELLDIGIEDYMSNKNIIIIEWAKRVSGIEKFAYKIIKVKIEHGKKNGERRIEII